MLNASFRGFRSYSIGNSSFGLKTAGQPGARPEIRFCNRIRSGSSRANGPGDACGTSALGSGEAMRPYAGLNPYRPLSAHGTRIEPPMSDPIASVAIPAASAAADPPDEPPGV